MDRSKIGNRRPSNSCSVRSRNDFHLSTNTGPKDSIAEYVLSVRHLTLE